MRRTYTSPASLSLNHWGLVGSWNVGPEAAVLQAEPGKVMFRFHARDLDTKVEALLTAAAGARVASP